ncbi:hypothetical protein FJZ33_03165 [Candidatus Poribacteria bacterium]|nr:hypothetical protein [Candidatus Poribacteria bacterium]
MTEDKIKDLQKIFKGDLDLMLFYVTWIKVGLNASKAYKELHPNVDNHSARVLGSRQLAKVDKKAIMEAYGLDQQLYFTQLKEALGATKWNDFTGEREADHKTRQAYHDKLGTLLGIETDKPLIQLNELKMEIVQDDKEEVKQVAV